MTERRQRFIQEFLQDLNGTQAAIRAGYSPRSARTTADRLLTNADIQAAIAVAKQERAERVAVTAEQVVEELTKVAFADLGDFMRIDPDGAVRPDFASLPVGATRVLASIEVDEYRDGNGNDARPVRRTRLRLQPKLRALELLLRHLAVGDGGQTALEIAYDIQKAQREIQGRMHGVNVPDEK